MRTLRASELGSYVYCARSWWYQRQGIAPENSAELASGTELHRVHGKRVMSTVLLRGFAWFVLVVGLILFIFALTRAIL